MVYLTCTLFSARYSRTMPLTSENFKRQEQALQMCTLAGWPAETAAKLAPLLVAGL